MANHESDVRGTATPLPQAVSPVARVCATLAAGRVLNAVLDFAFPAYALFIFGFFLAPKMPEHYEYFYWTLLPVAALLVPRGYALLKGSRLFWLVFAYLAYMAASSAWSEPVSIDESLFGIRLMLYVLAFVLVSVVLLQEMPQRFETLLKTACALAAVTAVVAMLVFYADHPFPAGRLHGIGRMEYIIRTGYIFGLFAVLALYYLIQERRQLLRVAYAAMIAVLLVAVVLTESRAALAAMFFAAAVLGLSDYRKWIAMLAAASALLVAAVWLLVPELGEGFSRGLPYRPEIWLHWLSRTWETAPLFGHGLRTQWPLISPALPYWEAHNAFVGTFRDGGVTGLALLVAVVAYAFVLAVRLARTPDGRRCLALMGYLLICILANDDRLLIRPQELWLYFWLPLVLVMVGEGKARGVTVSSGSA